MCGNHCDLLTDSYLTCDMNHRDSLTSQQKWISEDFFEKEKKEDCFYSPAHSEESETSNTHSCIDLEEEGKAQEALDQKKKAKAALEEALEKE